MLVRVSFALVVSLLAALAVQLSYGGAFLDSIVGYSSTAYVSALGSAAARPAAGGLINRSLFRASVGAVVGLMVLASLRSWAMFPLPFGDYLTSGHTPFFAFPAAALVSVLLLDALAALIGRLSAGAADDGDAASVSEG